MGAAERYLDILAMNPMVIGGKNVVRTAADVTGTLWQSVKGAAYVRMFPDPVITPKSIPGLVTWLEADAGITYGTWPNVSAWADQSGAGLITSWAATGNIPLVPASIGNRPALTFNNATFFASSAANLVSVDRGARTVITVAKPRTAVGGALFTFRRTGQNFQIGCANGGGSNVVYWNTGGLAIAVNDTFLVAGKPHVYCHSCDGRFATVGSVTNATDSHPRTRVDGVDVGLSFSGFATVENGTTGATVGMNENSPGGGFDGDIAAIYAWNRQITQAEFNSFMRFYVVPKYSLGVTLGKTSISHFGDSQTYGTNDTAAGGYIGALNPLHPNLSTVGAFYVPDLGDGNSNRREGYVGFNSGTSGAFALGGANLVASWAANPADVVLLMIGINDAFGSLFTAAQTAANVRAICDYIGSQTPGVKIIVSRSVRGRSDQAFNGVLDQQGPALVTALSGCPYVVAVVIPPTFADTFYSDGSHLNTAGNQRLAKEVFHPVLLALGL